MDPVPDPILFLEKFLGYSRESNPGLLGWQSDVLTTIPNRWSKISNMHSVYWPRCGLDAVYINNAHTRARARARTHTHTHTHTLSLSLYLSLIHTYMHTHIHYVGRIIKVFLKHLVISTSPS